MSDFDESKVQRDERGRFSGGGLGGFVAKHTGMLPKLEGYSGAKAGLDKWAGKVEGRQRDVEIPFASKTGGDFSSTGNLPMNEKTISQVTAFLRGNLRESMKNDTVAAMQSAEKSYNAQERATQKVTKERDQLKGDVASLRSMGAENHADELKTKETALASLEGKVTKSEGKLATAKDKMDSAYTEHRNANEREEALSHAIEAIEHSFAKEAFDRYGPTDPTGTKEGAYNPIKGGNVPIKLEAWKESGATLNVSVDRKDGSVDVHLAGVSHDPKYPGDKELHLTITPGKIPNAKGAWDPKGVKNPPGIESRVESISVQHPSDERGKPHPNDVEKENRDYGSKSTFYLPNELREHVQKFLKS